MQFLPMVLSSQCSLGMNCGEVMAVLCNGSGWCAASATGSDFDIRNKLPQAARMEWFYKCDRGWLPHALQYPQLDPFNHCGDDAGYVS